MTTLAVEQPTYLPNFEFFFKMKNSDVFVLADCFEYSSRSLVNRTRIKTAAGVRWLTVPMLKRGRQHQRDNEILIDRSQKWGRNHWRSLWVSYCMAPYFGRYSALLEKTYRAVWERLFDLNFHLIQRLSSELLFKGRLLLASQLPAVKNRTQRVLAWLKATGCNEYLVSKQQLPLIDGDIITNQGYTLKCYDLVTPEYHQQFDGFSANLSIIDMMFNEGPLSIELLTSRRLLHVY